MLFVADSQSMAYATLEAKNATSMEDLTAELKVNVGAQHKFAAAQASFKGIIANPLQNVKPDEADASPSAARRLLLRPGEGCGQGGAFSRRLVGDDFTDKSSNRFDLNSTNFSNVTEADLGPLPPFMDFFTPLQRMRQSKVSETKESMGSWGQG